MKALWKFLDGKKTAIGAIFSLATAYGIAKGWIGPAEETLFLSISTLIVGLGIGHKVVK